MAKTSPLNVDDQSSFLESLKRLVIVIQNNWKFVADKE